MKTVITTLVLVFSFGALACQCDYGDSPLKDETPAIESALKKKFGDNIEISRDRLGSLETKWIKAYPFLEDRLFAREFRGTSCESRGPNNEELLPCSNRYKNDYEMSLKLASGKTCKAVIQVKITTKKAQAKVLSTDC